MKKSFVYDGSLESFTSFQIRINVSQMEEGEYTLRIVNKGRVIKETRFVKTNNINN